jgi:hypothetical protein
MECFFAFILVLITIAVLGGVGGGTARRAVGSRAAFEALGKKYRGVVRGTGWFGNPNVVFNYRESRVVVRITKENSASSRRTPATQVIIQWPNPAFHCEIWPAASATLSRVPAGLQVVSTGSPEFDRNFVVCGQDREEIESVINPVVQRQVQRIYALPAPWRFHIRFAYGSLVVTKDQVIRRVTELQDFVADVLEFFDQALLTQSRGIEFVDALEAQLLEDVSCRVCGERITHDLVFCRRCKTPHHRDCWLYNGACSVFACGESNFEVPRVAPSSPSREIDEDRP